METAAPLAQFDGKVHQRQTSQRSKRGSGLNPAVNRIKAVNISFEVTFD